MRPVREAIRDRWRRRAERRRTKRQRSIERQLASRHEEPVPLADPRFGRGPRP